MKKDNSIVKDLTIEWNNQTIQIRINSDGHTFVHTNGEVTKLHPESPDIGDVMSDGSIYVGYIHDKHWYARPKDEPLTMTFNDAAEYAKTLEAHEKRDWVVPPRAVMRQMYKHKDLIGCFDPAGKYWANSGRAYGLGWQTQFATGDEYNIATRKQAKIRCVRSDSP